jgi:RNA polymerase sigma factor (sigma-70 family)
MAQMTEDSAPDQRSASSPTRRGETTLAHWVREYAEDLRRFLAKRRIIESDIKDVCQEVYLRLLRFDRSEVVKNPQAYLYRVAANVAHDFKLRRARWTGLDDSTLDELAVEASPEQLFETDTRASALARAMAALPPLPRAALVLQYHESLTYEQIAERLGVSRRVVKRAIARGYALMRTALQEHL